MKKINFNFRLLILIGVLIMSINQVWATTRTFKSGEKIYFKDAWKSAGNTQTWKMNTGKVSAYFYGDGDGWYHCWGSDNVSGEWDTDGTIYEITVPGTGKNFTGVIFTRGTNGDSFDNVWNQTSNQTPDIGRNLFTVNNTVTDSKYGGSWGRYSKTYVLVGDFNDWDPDQGSFTDGKISFELEDKTTYQFKLLNGETYYGNNYGFVGQSGAQTMTSGLNNCKVFSAKDGTYEFTLTTSPSLTLAVDYPDEAHPSSNYIYYKNVNVWGEVHINLWGSATGSGTSFPGPQMEAITLYGELYYFAALGAETSAQFSNGGDGGKTGEYGDVRTYGFGKYLDRNTYPYYITFTANISFDRQGATDGDASATPYFDPSFALGALSDITVPTDKSGYSFAGYYTATGGGGSEIINSDGEWQEVSGFTKVVEDDKYWIKAVEESSFPLYAKWTQSVTLKKHNDESDGSVTVTYNSSSHSSIASPERTGYTFAGWYTAETDGTLIIATDGTLQNSTSYTDASGKWTNSGSAPTLHAHWTPVALSFKADASTSAWGSKDNWSPACVPTSGHDVTIKKAVTVSGSAEAKSIAFDGGSLTIESTGALEVAGTIDNDNPNNINVAAGGALIFANSAGTTRATVDLSLTSSRWQMIAIPVGYVNVSEAFYGATVYTYVWKHGEGWERRGYYDGVSAFESVLIKGCTGYTFSGTLVSTDDQSFTASYDGTKDNGDVTMYGNSWPAPIAVSGMGLEAATIDGAVHVFTGSGWAGVTKGYYIPALQGYAVVADESAESRTVSIPYSAVRAVPSANRNTELRAPKRTTSDIFDHITIYVSGNEWKTRIRLYENEQFSDEIDKGYEAIHMEGEGFAGELYAVGSEKKMNVLAVPDLEGTVVGFVPGEATTYTISFDGDGRGYYLNDISTGESTLIEEANTYNFKSDETTNATRFVVSKMPLMPTGVDEVADGSKARKQMIDGTLYIIRDGRIYDATGSLVK